MPIDPKKYWPLVEHVVIDIRNVVDNKPASAESLAITISRIADDGDNAAGVFETIATIIAIQLVQLAGEVRRGDRTHAHLMTPVGDEATDHYLGLITKNFGAAAQFGPRSSQSLRAQADLESINEVLRERPDIVRDRILGLCLHLVILERGRGIDLLKVTAGWKATQY